MLEDVPEDPKENREVETTNMPGIMQKNVQIEELSGFKLENVPDEESDCVGNIEDEMLEIEVVA